MKLYELAQNYQEVLEDLEDRETEPTEEEWKALLSVEDDFDAKVLAYGKVIRTLEAQGAAVKAEVQRMRARGQAFENRASWLRSTLQAWLESVGREKVKDATLTVALRACPMLVEVVDENLVPLDFVKLERRVEKSEVLAHVKATGEIPAGVNIVTDRKSLSIR